MYIMSYQEIACLVLKTTVLPMDGTTNAYGTSNSTNTIHKYNRYKRRVARLITRRRHVARVINRISSKLHFSLSDTHNHGKLR